MSDIQDIDESSVELYSLINDSAYENENLVGYDLSKSNITSKILIFRSSKRESVIVRSQPGHNSHEENVIGPSHQMQNIKQNCGSKISHDLSQQLSKVQHYPVKTYLGKPSDNC